MRNNNIMMLMMLMPTLSADADHVVVPDADGDACV